MTLLVVWLVFGAALHAQQETVRIDIKSALERARAFSPQLRSESLAVDIARIDRYLARSAFLPTVDYHNQYLYTQGNGTPGGVFMANNGIHEYFSQGVARQDIYVPGRMAEYRRSAAVEAVAAAKRDVAVRGILMTVFQNYYGIVVSQRHLTNALQSLDEARRFVEITGKLVSGGEVAHADAVKAQLMLNQRERDVQDARLSVEKNKISLAVLIFPDLNTDFSVTDDIASAPTLAEFNQIQQLANKTNPDLRAAHAAVTREQYGVSVARGGYFPKLTLDYFFGIDAPQFAARDSEGFRRLGSAAQATLDIPIFNWWATRKKVKQADLKRQQAQLDLVQTERQLSLNLRSSYLEAQTAFGQLDSLRSSMDLAAESLRLTYLRYEAGESTALEVADAQTTLTRARNAYDDGLFRYRLAIATIQTMTENY